MRDKTGTADSIELTVSSILACKAAEGIKALVMDVKCGESALFKVYEESKKLAE